MPDLFTDIPQEAFDRLSELEAAEAGANADAGGASGASQRDTSPADRATQAGAAASQPAAGAKASATEVKTGAEAAASDGQPGGDSGSAADRQKGSGQEQEQEQAKEQEGKKSRYAKSQERLGRTWDEVNKRKGELDTREQQLLARETQLKSQQQLLQQQSQRAASQNSPEDYIRAGQSKLARAQALSQQADGLEARAERLEQEGKNLEAARAQDQARNLRKQAAYEEVAAQQLGQHAEQLRRNPPPTLQEQQAQKQAQVKEWALKAGTDYPELGKPKSELQGAVAQMLRDLPAQAPGLSNDPQIIYHVTRLCAAELAARRVPALTKELETTRARVKELEALTHVGGEQIPARGGGESGEKTLEQEGNELRDLANQVGAFR